MKHASKIIRTLTVCCLSSILFSAHAQTIYKSVDEDGNISYTSTPPVDMENVKVMPATLEPTQEEVDEANLLQQQLELERQKRYEARKNLAEQEAEAKAQANSTQVLEQTLGKQVVPVPVIRKYPRSRPLNPNRPVARPLPVNPPTAVR
jgi:hypothetical protein